MPRLSRPWFAPPPTPAERDALAIAAGYLARASTAAASRLLGHGPDADIALALTLRDQFEGGAALCRGLLDAVAADDDWLLRLP